MSLQDISYNFSHCRVKSITLSQWEQQSEPQHKETQQLETQDFYLSQSVKHSFYSSIKNGEQFLHFGKTMVNTPAADGALVLPKPLRSFISVLVVALESFGHEQLPEVLRGEFLHVLAVVVNLPCWRGATRIHTPPYDTTQHPQKHMYRRTHTHRFAQTHKQAEVGKETAAQHQISGEGSGCCREEESWAGKQAAGVNKLEINVILT